METNVIHQHTTNDGIATTFEMIRTSISTMYTYLKLEYTYNKKNMSMQTPAYNMFSLKYEHYAASMRGKMELFIGCKPWNLSPHFFLSFFKIFFPPVYILYVSKVNMVMHIQRKSVAFCGYIRFEKKKGGNTQGGVIMIYDESWRRILLVPCLVLSEVLVVGGRCS